MHNDFSQGKVSTRILQQTLPLLCAQFVQLLYNVVDRIYIGHLSDIGSMALTGIGLVFPLTTLIAAFTQLHATGGTPLFSISRGEGNDNKAEKILSHVVCLLFFTSILLMGLCYVFKKSILYAFGASDTSYYYANQYLQIYLLGTVFTMFSTGLNGFINAQGFPRIGMMTVSIGAVLNLILDPIFIFLFHLGIQGAAIATVISQFISFAWVMQFFLGKRTQYHIQRKYLVLDFSLVAQIYSLGLAGFIVQGTNCAVQVVCNKMLTIYGGDIYLGIMTVLNSVREIAGLPVSTLGSGAQPVLGYNYGAKKYERVRKGIRFNILLGFTYTVFIWAMIVLFPKFFMSIFTSDAQLISEGTSALKLYFLGFCFMAFQFCGQSTFQALGCAKRSIFFSLFRKAIIVVPLTIYLPTFMGINGVFLAEPISNLVGGLASFTTMYITLYRRLPKEDK